MLGNFRYVKTEMGIGCVDKSQLSASMLNLSSGQREENTDNQNGSFDSGIIHREFLPMAFIFIQDSAPKGALYCKKDQRGKS